MWIQADQHPRLGSLSRLRYRVSLHDLGSRTPNQPPEPRTGVLCDKGEGGWAEGVGAGRGFHARARRAPHGHDRGDRRHALSRSRNEQEFRRWMALQSGFDG